MSTKSQINKYPNAVQLFFTFEPFHKNIRTWGATSNKLMYEATDSQDLNYKMEDMWLRHWHYYTITNSNLLQISLSVGL